jgi:hypothetical protein
MQAFDRDYKKIEEMGIEELERELMQEFHLRPVKYDFSRWGIRTPKDGISSHLRPY